MVPDDISHRFGEHWNFRLQFGPFLESFSFHRWKCMIDCSISCTFVSLGGETKRRRRDFVTVRRTPYNSYLSRIAMRKIEPRSDGISESRQQDVLGPNAGT